MSLWLPRCLHSPREALSKASSGFNTSVLPLWDCHSCYSSQHGVKGKGWAGLVEPAWDSNCWFYIWGSSPTPESQCSLGGKRDNMLQVYYVTDTNPSPSIACLGRTQQVTGLKRSGFKGTSTCLM